MERSEAERVCAYVGLGSNLKTPLEQIKKARSAIISARGINEIGFSSLYRSAPMGPQNQPDYINAVMAVNTQLSANELLSLLQAIENEQGRVRNGERWGARTLDLDLLIYSNEIIQTLELTVPHPGIPDRAFVLYPLFELNSQLQIPGMGNIADLIEKCPSENLTRLQ